MIGLSSATKILRTIRPRCCRVCVRRAGSAAKVDTAFGVAALLSILTLLFLSDSAGRALRLKFIPKELAFAGFACFEGQGFAFRRNDGFGFAEAWEERLVTHPQCVSQNPVAELIVVLILVGRRSGTVAC